jgi:predicted ester cyclase
MLPKVQIIDARSEVAQEVRSGKPVDFCVFDVCRFKDARLVEHWGVPDRFALLHQAGARPPL